MTETIEILNADVDYLFERINKTKSESNNANSFFYRKGLEHAIKILELDKYKKGGKKNEKI